MKESRLIAIASDVVAATQRRLPPEIREAARAGARALRAVARRGRAGRGVRAGPPRALHRQPATGPSSRAGSPEPPRIFLYTANLWDYAEEDVEAFRDEVRLTYLHELGHFLGWDEDQIAARGLD